MVVLQMHLPDWTALNMIGLPHTLSCTNENGTLLILYSKFLHSSVFWLHPSIWSTAVDAWFFLYPIHGRQEMIRKWGCLWWGNQSILQNSPSHNSYRVTTKCQELCWQHERVTINSADRILVLTELGSPCKKPKTLPSIELWVTEGRQRGFLRHEVGEGLSQAAPWEMLNAFIQCPWQKHHSHVRKNFPALGTNGVFIASLTSVYQAESLTQPAS